MGIIYSDDISKGQVIELLKNGLSHIELFDDELNLILSLEIMLDFFLYSKNEHQKSKVISFHDL